MLFDHAQIVTATDGAFAHFPGATMEVKHSIDHDRLIYAVRRMLAISSQSRHAIPPENLTRVDIINEMDTGLFEEGNQYWYSRYPEDDRAEDIVKRLFPDSMPFVTYPSDLT